MLTWFRVVVPLLLFMFYFEKYNCFMPPNYNTNSKLTNVPIRSDLGKFLNVLKKVTNYFHKNLNVLFSDLSTYFGIFLANVNLKHALHKKRRRLKVESQLHEIIDLNAVLMRHFLDKTKENNKLNNQEKIILKHLSKESEWIKNIANFTSNKIKDRTTEATRYIFSDKKIYSNKILAVDVGVPDPETSDKCLASLTHEPLNSNMCTIDKSCFAVLKNGTNYGYALTHRGITVQLASLIDICSIIVPRLLLLQMADYSDCSIFSKSEDRYLANRFCSMLYVEAEFIAIQNFDDGLVDLMLEIMCLCGLNGHAQFLNRSWLDRMKRYQTPYGCFSLDLKKMEYIIRQETLKWKVFRTRNYDILNGLCDEHVSTLAMATYAEAVRFIIEIYY